MLSAHPHIKHWLESAAITTALWTWLANVPWGQLAAFVSFVYVSLQMGYWIYQRIKGRNE